MVYVLASAILAAIAAACALFALHSRRELASALDEIDRMKEERQVIIEFLHRSADDIGSGANREKIYKRIVRATALSCGAMSACVYEKSPDGRLVAKACEGLFPPQTRKIEKQKSGELRAEFIEDALRREVVEPNEGVLGEVAASGKGVLIRDALKDPRVIRHEDESLKIRSLMVVPLVFRGQLGGVLAVANPISGRAFTETEFSLARSLGEQCALALQNAEAVSALIMKNKLEFDLRLASSVQRYLLPENLPEIPGLEFAVKYLPQQLIGGDFLRDARALEKLLAYQNDEKVLADLMAIKRKNKERLAALIENQNGVRVDPDSIFDIQIKRLHEYKRQLLNILHVLYLYRQIKANPHGDFMPRTFIFAAKASAGYIRAKQIISLIVAASKLINNDPDVNDKLKVVFLEDYKVSLAEIIIPAADISEQISVAGKEASGTGNMKLMINGAVTIGTLDGANVEIHEQVGDENIFLFGMKAHEVEELWQRGYHPTEFVTPELQAVLDMLTSGVLGQRFDDLVDSLLTNRFGTADPYMTLADFQDYARAQRDVAAVYQDKQHFARMSLINIAKAGIFSSDRAVKEYADEIWNLD